MLCISILSLAISCSSPTDGFGLEASRQVNRDECHLNDEILSFEEFEALLDARWEAWNKMMDCLCAAREMSVWLGDDDIEDACWAALEGAVAAVCSGRPCMVVIGGVLGALGKHMVNAGQRLLVLYDLCVEAESYGAEVDRLDIEISRHYVGWDEYKVMGR